MPKNIFLNSLVNIVIPILILTQAKGSFNPLLILVLALAFPIFYGIIDMKLEKRINFLSLLGFLSIALTGVISILELGNKFLIWKEAGIPLAIAFIILASEHTEYPVTRKLLGEIFNLKKIKTEFKKIGKEKVFERNLKISAYILSATFFISAVANFVITDILVKSPPGTLRYNQEIAKVLTYSFTIITTPMTTILILIVIGIIWSVHKNTKLELEEITW